MLCESLSRGTVLLQRFQGLSNLLQGLAIRPQLPVWKVIIILKWVALIYVDKPVIIIYITFTCDYYHSHNTRIFGFHSDKKGIRELKFSINLYKILIAKRLLKVFSFFFFFLLLLIMHIVFLVRDSTGKTSLLVNKIELLKKQALHEPSLGLL